MIKFSHLFYLEERADATLIAKADQLINDYINKLITKKDKLFDYVVNKIPGLVLGRGCSIFLKEQGVLGTTKKIFLAYTNSPVLKIDKQGRNVIDLHYKYGEGKTGFVADIKRSLLINYYGDGKIQEKKLANNYLKYSKNTMINVESEDANVDIKII